MNNIELITKYSPKAWDTVYKQESVIANYLDADPKLVRFEGAKTVKIGKFQTGGLHDYYRNNNAGGFGDTRVPEAPATGTNFVNQGTPGYQKSAMSLVWEDHTMRCDRAAAFQVETFDNEESGGELVGLGVAEISRTVIIPEVDSYAISTIASYCTTELGNLVTEDFTTEDAKPLRALNKAFTYMANHEVPIKDQVVFASPEYMNALRNTSEVTKFLGQTDYNNKDINFLVTKYEGRTLVEVSPERLRTNIVLFGREGYGWGANSKAINYLMVSKEAVIHVVKYEKVKVIGGELNLAGNGFDGYTVYARIYHDVFVPDNKRIALYCSVADGVEAPAMKLDVLLTNDNKVKSITTHPGNVLVHVVTSSAEETVGKATTGTLTPFVSGQKVASETTVYAVDSYKKVLAKATVTPSAAE